MKLRGVIGALLTALFWVGGLSAAGPEVQVSLSPRVVAVGERVTYTLTLARQPDEGFSLPPLENGRWITNEVHRVSQNINGVKEFSFRIPILAEREGGLAIPAFSVKAGGKTLPVPAQEVKVVAAESLPVPDGAASLKESVFGAIRVPDARRSWYVGEEIDLELTLWMRAGVRAEVREYPELAGLEQVLFRDYDGGAPGETRRFDRPSVADREVKGQSFRVITFRTAFRAAASGKLTPKASLTVGIPEASERSNDLLGSFFRQERLRAYPVTFAPGPELTILPLPPAPAGWVDLGLIGRWQVAGRFDQPQGKVGEPLTLVIAAEGEGAFELLKTPKPELPGFRIYPGEVEKAPGRVTIRYAAIPLAEGVKRAELKYLTFDPAKGEYARHEFQLTLPVEKGALPVPTSLTAAAPAADVAAEPEAQPVREELFYLKAAPGGEVRMPLFANRLGLSLGLFGGALALFAGTLLVEFRRRQRENDPDFQARREVKQRLAALRKRLQRGESGHAFLTDEVMPALLEALKLSPWTEPEELGRALESPDMGELFREAKAARFRPGGGEAAPLPEAARKKLAGVLKKLSLLFCLLFPFLLPGGEAWNAAYEKGDYPAAIALYRQGWQPGAARPNALYNLGSACYAAGNLPEARLALLRAHLLAPRDSETLENLNLVNRKLRLPEQGKTDSALGFLTYLRDRLRPDEYLLLLAGAALFASLAFALRNRFRPSTQRGLFGGAGLVALLILAALASQALGPYHPARAVVTAAALELKTLPSAGSGRVEATIPGGGSARIIEDRGEWLRVEAGGRDGWVKKEGLQRVLPRGMF